MPKDKDKSINPAQAQRKLEKSKALKKSKADLQAKRNEKLARRNPDRIQRQIDDLKALEAGGDIKPREKAILADLERDLKSVKRAREVVGGDKGAAHGQSQSHGARPAHAHRRDDRVSISANNVVLGKRRFDGQRSFSPRRNASGSDTDESVRNIPWPRDTPPPVPREWRRDRHDQNSRGQSRSQSQSQPQGLPARPIEAPRTTYESAPQLRDLKKEAVSRFVPNVVKRKQEAIKGTSAQLLEPEEMDRLEREGYIRNIAPASGTEQTSTSVPIDTDEIRRLKAEEEAFERELAMQTDGPEEKGPSDVAEPVATGSRLLPSRHVEMEEVEDEDG